MGWLNRHLAGSLIISWYKGTNPIHKNSTLMTNHPQGSTTKDHQLGLGLQHMNGGGKQTPILRDALASYHMFCFSLSSIEALSLINFWAGC